MVYITAIHLAGGSEHEHVASVRWLNAENGQSGESDRAAMVEWLDRVGTSNIAKVAGPQGSAQVGVVDSQPKYLRTYADGQWSNNLLSLPKF